VKASKSARLPVAFVLTLDSIQRLIEILTPFSTSIKFSVDLSDGSKAYPTTVEELSRFPNTEKRKIKALSIENDWGDQVNADISFNTDYSWDSISYSFKGEDDDVLVLDHRVADWIGTIRQKYSALAFSSRYSYLFFALILGLGITLVSIPSAVDSRMFPKHPYAPIAFVITGLILQAVAWTSGWVRRKLFPTGMFAIGAGKDRIQEVRERRKQWSIVSIFIAVAVGLLDAWLLKLIGS
jgi:hypothetical protein